MKHTLLVFTSIITASFQFTPCLAEAEPAAAPKVSESSGKDMVDEKEAAANRLKAKEAWNSDQKTLGAEEFASMEKEYQEINTNYKTPQIKDLLEKFITKWKKGNRVGCATLYLAQKSGGEQRETLLKKCVGEFSDSYYLDGTQVGGLGRLFLASYYKQAGAAKDGERKKLIAELRKDFPSAQDHRRLRIVDQLKAIAD